MTDRARREPDFVDGSPPVVDGALVLGDPVGHGMTLRPEAQRWRTRCRPVADRPPEETP